MWFTDLIRLSFKNLTHRFADFAMMFITIVLLGVALLIMGSFCYGIYASIEKSALKDLNTTGAVVSFENPDPDAIVPFLDEAKKNKVFVFYDSEVNQIAGKAPVVVDSHEIFSCKVFLPEGTAKNKPDLLDGEHWSAESADTDLWLTEGQAAKYRRTIGGRLRLRVENKETDYTVCGIISGDYAYLHYRAVPLSQLIVSNPSPNFTEIDLRRLIEFTEPIALSSPIIDDLRIARINELLPISVGLILVFAVVGLSLGSIVNTLRINIETNTASIGTFKALGMRNRDIYWYVMLQTTLIITLGTAIATLIAFPIVFFALPTPIAAMMRTLNISLSVQHTGLTLFMPFAVLLLLLIAVFCASAPMMRKFLHNNTDAILRNTDN